MKLIDIKDEDITTLTIQIFSKACNSPRGKAYQTHKGTTHKGKHKERVYFHKEREIERIRTSTIYSYKRVAECLKSLTHEGPAKAS